MTTSNKEQLIEHLTKLGRNMTWAELGLMYGMTQDQARHAWTQYNKAYKGPAKESAPKVATPSVLNYGDAFNAVTDNLTKTPLGKAPGRVESLEDLIVEGGIDTSKWNIKEYRQSYTNNKWNMSATMTKVEEATYHENFKSFLSNYTPKSNPVNSYRSTTLYPDRHCLVINKQDSHLDKFDRDGENNMQNRMKVYYNSVQRMINNASRFNLEKIVYVIGSDEFNSEWMNTTTKGTPQENIGTFHERFENVCNHEIAMIELMLTSTDVEVLYIPGNHDEYVGWHMIKWLETYFRNDARVKFESTPEYTKYVQYGDTAMMFNHGDVMKPLKLAQIFPMEFKNWSQCNHQYIFIGDKHNELTMDISGIKVFQLPALSKAKSLWDKKRGYGVTKSEVTGFLVHIDRGLTVRYSEEI